MAARFVRPATALLALALLVPATGAAARTHHRTASTHHKAGKSAAHRKASHHGSKSHETKSHETRNRETDRHKTRSKPVEHHAAAPAGASSVPGPGLKLFCPPHKNPLLIRKATQGAGTTVTVVCR
jgi:hypothetical protein